MSDYKFGKLEVIFSAKDMAVNPKRRVEPELGRPSLTINPFRIVRGFKALALTVAAPVASRPLFGVKVIRRITARSLTVGRPSLQRPAFAVRQKRRWWEFW
jgi:hypothetical protein